MKTKELKKINELFEYRKLPFLLNHFVKKDKKWMHRKLIDLQVAIYDLDRYLESNWKLKSDKLDHYWSKIYSQLNKLDFTQSEISILVKHIQKYQLHESQLRENKLPTRLSFEYYYYYKSCDVRLMREIINIYNDILRSKIDVASWRYYDLITEMNDDIEDVFEDQLTINGNLFNIMIFEHGLKHTEKAFKYHLDNILKKSERKFKHSKNAYEQKIRKWTLKRHKQTTKLMEKQLIKIKKKRLKKSNSKLYSRL